MSSARRAPLACSARPIAAIAPMVSTDAVWLLLTNVPKTPRPDIERGT